MQPRKLKVFKYFGRGRGVEVVWTAVIYSEYHGNKWVQMIRGHSPWFLNSHGIIIYMHA
jgi:hypothetical protein